MLKQMQATDHRSFRSDVSRDAEYILSESIDSSDLDAIRDRRRGFSKRCRALARRFCSDIRPKNASEDSETDEDPLWSSEDTARIKKILDETQQPPRIAPQIGVAPTAFASQPTPRI